MKMHRLVFRMGRQRILAVVIFTAVVFMIGCSSTEPSARPTTAAEIPATVEVIPGATVDALVSERLQQAARSALRATATAEVRARTPATPTASPETPTPAPTATPDPDATPDTTATPAPTSTPMPVDDHGDDEDSATEITSTESLVVVLGNIETLDDQDHFSFVNADGGKSWVFTPEYLPPETASGRFPNLEVNGVSSTADPFTGVISVTLGAGTVYLMVTSETFQRTGDYRVVVDRVN